MFYYRHLKIRDIESQVEQIIENPGEERQAIDVSFLPEGGVLLAEHNNVLGIKAIDQYGNSISVQGEIADDEGKVITSFSTEFHGMDTIHLNPRVGIEYSTRVFHYPDYKPELQEIVKEGIKIEFAGETEEDLLFRVSANSSDFEGKYYHFSILHRGEEIFKRKLYLQNGHFPIAVNRDALPPGINRLVLSDEQLLPISERLYFSNHLKINKLQLSFDQDEYETRSRVQLEIYDDAGVDFSSYSNLSIAVVDEKTVPDNGPELNILSWLLLDSELKGVVESPSAYFSDTDDFSSEYKLNLLMLTQGWSRYIWNVVHEPGFSTDIETREGILIEGMVKHAFTKKPLARADVELNVYNRNTFIIADEKTDRQGRFSFDSIFFTDTAAFFIQGRNRRGKYYTVVTMDSVFKENPKLATTYLPKNTGSSKVPSVLFEQQYYSEREIRDYLIEHGSIPLPEIIKVGKKKQVGDGHFRVYGKPIDLISLEVNEKDYGYMNVAQYLQGRVAGLRVSGNSIVIHGSGSFQNNSSTPLYVLDGTYMPEEVIMAIPMSDIDVIEVLKNVGSAGTFGVRGGNGVISVFTKKGLDWSNVETQFPGTIKGKIAGYAIKKVFYSPRYTKENIHSEKPDHRLTLYWNPNIFTENGIATTDFYSSDDVSQYRVFVEGITNQGKICLGSSKFRTVQLDSGSR